MSERAFVVVGVKKRRRRRIPFAVLCFGWAFQVTVSALPLVTDMRLKAIERLNERDAIGALRTIATSESIFREGDAKTEEIDYGTLAQLSQDQLIDSVLGSGTKCGYLFAAAPSTSTSEFLWFAVAGPQKPGVTGDRYFCTNHAAVIFYTTTSSFSLNTTDCQIAPNARPVGQ